MLHFPVLWYIAELLVGLVLALVSGGVLAVAIRCMTVGRPKQLGQPAQYFPICSRWLAKLLIIAALPFSLLGTAAGGLLLLDGVAHGLDFLLRLATG